MLKILPALVPFLIALTIAAEPADPRGQAQELRWPLARGSVGVFNEAPFPLEIPAGVVPGRDFRFGYVNVPVRHGRPEGDQLRIAVAVIRSREPQAASDPLLICTSGPGTSGIESLMRDFAGGQHPVLARRDAVVIELRGLCHSEPNLLCPERWQMQSATLGENLQGEAMLRRLVDAYRAAYRRLVRDGIDVGAFNNFETAADIDMIMTALGYREFNLFGNSAGTLIAQHVMRSYPNRLRCVILSSSVPLGEPAFQSMVGDGLTMFHKVMSLFAANAEFAAAHPDLESRFLQLLDELNAKPVTLPVTDPATGQTHQLVLNGDRLAQWLFQRMFFNPRFPIELGKITLGDYAPLLQQNGAEFFAMPTFSYGLGNSIMLTEPVGPSAQPTEIPASYTAFAKALAGGGFGPEFMKRLETVWKVERLKLSPERSLPCDVPTLILCGELDHVCPPRYAEIISRRLTNVQVVVFPGIAHSPIDAGLVPIQIVLQFLEDPTQPPDTSGLKDFRLHISGE